MNLLICDGRVAVQDQLRVLILQLFNRPEARSMTIEEIAKQVNAGRDYQFGEAEVRSVAEDLEMDNKVMWMWTLSTFSGSPFQLVRLLLV